MLKSIVCVLVIGLAASFAHAADVYWDGGGGDALWTTVENWASDVLPTDVDNAYISDCDPGLPQPLVDSTVTASAKRVVVGQTGPRPCTLTITGGSITSSGDYPFAIGNKAGGIGILDISGGEAIASNSGFLVGCKDGAEGTINMSGGTITSYRASPTAWYHHFVIGDTVTGTLNMSGGILNAKNDMYLSRTSSGKGTVNMTGGTINVTGEIRLCYDSSASCEFHLDGGVVTAADLVMTANGSLDLMEGVMILDGDDTLAVWAYVDADLITGYGAASNVLVGYDTRNDKTIVAALVPEPATIALLGLGGLLSLRLRRRTSR